MENTPVTIYIAIPLPVSKDDLHELLDQATTNMDTPIIHRTEVKEESHREGLPQRLVMQIKGDLRKRDQ